VVPSFIPRKLESSYLLTQQRVDCWIIVSIKRPKHFWFSKVWFGGLQSVGSFNMRSFSVPKMMLITRRANGKFCE